MEPAVRRPIGRGQKVRSSVLTAALAELYAVGYADFNMESVARRAGVNKTTVYRRWRDRQSLVVDAVTEFVATEMPIPDTGVLAEDLREFARSLVRTLTSPAGRAMSTVILTAVQIPEIAEIRRRFFDDRFRRAEPVVRRAIERDEIPADTDPGQLVRALIAPIYLRLLVTAEELDEATAEQSVQITLAAARAGALHGLRGPQ